MAAAPTSFSSAKRIAEAQIYHDQRKTFYCGCRFSFADGPDLASCGYQVRKQPHRAQRVEWEHIMPAYDLGRQRQCWQEGGRRNCRATDAVFRQAEADLHNLVPSIGEVNGDRSNMRYGMSVSRDAYRYGQCQAKVDFSERTFEPPLSVRGDIARTYWYMRDKYGIRISRQQQQLFTAWARQDPIDAWERERDQRIENVQGEANPYVSGGSPVDAASPVGTAKSFKRSAPIRLPSSTLTAFSCASRKTCGAMASCAEATFHLQQCHNTRLDGDRDGVPCESLCR
nr:endonuclease [uncultured Halomonas sp.]